MTGGTGSARWIDLGFMNIYYLERKNQFIHIIKLYQRDSWYLFGYTCFGGKGRNKKEGRLAFRKR